MTEVEIYDELMELLNTEKERVEQSDNYIHKDYQRGTANGIDMVHTILFRKAQDIGKGYAPERCFGGVTELAGKTAARRESYLRANTRCPHCGGFGHFKDTLNQW